MYFKWSVNSLLTFFWSNVKSCENTYTYTHTHSYRTHTHFHNLQKGELLQQCQTLSTTLTHDSQPDINGTELAKEMQTFPPSPSKNMTNMELLTFLHEKKLAEIYPNVRVALRISATLPVTVAAAERSFSKLKFIKTYLRSTMQERLSGLSIISINDVVSNQLSYDDVVDDVAARKTGRVRL